MEHAPLPTVYNDFILLSYVHMCVYIYVRTYGCMYVLLCRYVCEYMYVCIYCDYMYERAMNV